ncbi:MAG: CoA-binding protein [Peptoniphilaceae bacterium]
MSLKEEMMNKKSWAIIGITDKEDKYGYKIPVLMKEHDYKVVGINPKMEELEGIKIYSNLKDIPGEIDVINMIVNPKIARIYLKEAKELGIENVFFQPGSYNSETIELAEELGFNIVLDCVYATLK